MNYQIKEFARLTGVSVRTLHYYDEIKLLEPAFVDEQNGYRFYDEKSLERMQEILFYRELDFSLKSISEILVFPNYNKQAALEKQKKLLILKKDRLEKIISAIDNAAKGEIFDMNVFDNSDFISERNKYAAEAKEKWGKTAAYKEYEKKSSAYSKEKYNELNSAISDIFGEFAECFRSGEKAYDANAQALVKKLQDFITENYYRCTDEILAGLGKMYIADERFKTNIDSHGSGTAEFVSAAIDAYCK